MLNPKKTRCVAVVGANGKMQRRVAKQSDGVARLIFIPSERSDTRYPKGTDAVVITRWSSHRSSVAARGLPTRFCYGGQSEICQAIRDLVEGPAGQRYRDN